MGRRFAVFLRAMHDARILRRAVLDLEPCPEHTDCAVVDFEHGLEVAEFDHAVPRTAAHLEGDVSLQARKQNSHHGSWLGRREWARAQYSDQRKRQEIAKTLGVVPADVEIAVALGTAHAGRAFFQPGTLAA